MLAESDCALLIGDPALQLSSAPGTTADTPFRTFDLAELWRGYTGFGFVFAMWMTRARVCPVDFVAVRDEGLEHIDEIVANYAEDIALTRGELKRYLTTNISFSIDETMQKGLKLYFELAFKNGLIERNKTLDFAA